MQFKKLGLQVPELAVAACLVTYPLLLVKTTITETNAAAFSETLYEHCEVMTWARGIYMQLIEQVL